VSEVRALLRATAELAADYVESLGERPVFPRIEPEQLREALGGQLCRCTGYVGIVAAVRAAAAIDDQR
jgi:aerobic-type carbon monoxide dehydrogenase small subunit (CoxS/CutS family)